MSTIGTVSEGKRKACKTYIEQTKLLVTLASAFLFAPAGFVAILKEKDAVLLAYSQVWWLVIAEALFILSVLAGYVTLGALTGSQSAGDFDVFRPAIRVASLIQIGLYVAGIVTFIWLAIELVT